MNFTTRSTALILVIICLASCANKEDEEAIAPEPVKPPLVKKQTVSAPAAPTRKDSPFRTLKDDASLPTQAQMAEGAESSIGTNTPAALNPDRPSAAIKPPSPEPAPTTNKPTPSEPSLTD